ncbi:acyl-CoA synthetase, AMP-forming [Geobacter metallireducens GS-15]|uniref:Acyl-CoA synthetase, AMP-forming n=1 Tax=Geobacter metallireducens (strain ATCC 53774 / DSM 7210 / GS-15) TaxID=269799 RepID=Q39TG8_GEOMG|nr:class I adenylate-forming enzyme family protein [Geobacter metallireducens]ABB32456.1 acyl-CoA synthetase, AMP-forming [Geobacter metallireducens GS-15]
MNWADYLEWGTRENPHKPLVYCNDKIVTYGEMSSWTNCIGNVLADLDVSKGERVATYLPNTPEHEAVLLGALKLGAIGCPLSMRENNVIVIDLLRGLEAKVLVVGAESVEFAREVLQELPELKILMADDASLGFLSLGELVGTASAELETLPMRDSEVAFIAYTGGTTGRPKGVQLTAGMLRAHNYVWYERYQLSRASEVFFGCLSLWHVGGVLDAMALSYTTGASHVLLPKWNPVTALHLVKKHRVTCMIAATTLYQQMSRCDEFLTTDCSSLKICAVGGEPVPVELKERWFRVTGASMREGFGMSEACTQVFAPGKDAPLSSCGKPFDRIEEVRLVDPESRCVIEGAGSGELAVRGDNVTPGYWHDPEQTGRKFDAEGWYYTGDMVRRDEDGYYYTVGRVDDMFQSGGENVYPSEIEAALVLHPDVTKAFCFPEPHTEWGKAACAVVELRPGATSNAERILEFCTTHSTLARFKRPRRIFCIDELPIGATGKVLRRQVKEWLAAQGYHAEF